MEGWAFLRLSRTERRHAVPPSNVVVALNASEMFWAVSSERPRDPWTDHRGANVPIDRPCIGFGETEIGLERSSQLTTNAAIHSARVEGTDLAYEKSG